MAKEFAGLNKITLWSQKVYNTVRENIAVAAKNTQEETINGIFPPLFFIMLENGTL